ncbi:uncharacterized protein LOC133848404 isoform X2 [Drosophila sulfurigaster albostrigata]|uniref:uncharacterized protein LOC133848404 isoform X2 n=1 Tax=Drosophila sulfurigaster albostrigata TaxID=89887 RepID=UPI002D21C713|nr:uncharacterized protein LOC133848404 isoform X2 [Drosophila sulfurigaster albostrigata]
MNAAVCVMVTVPTELEEKRCLQPHLRQRMRDREKANAEQLSANAPLEQVLRSIVEKLRLEQVFWSQDLAGCQLQARFDLQQDERYERLLSTLQDWGIGERAGTQVTAINCLETRLKRGATGAGAGAAKHQQQQQQQQQRQHLGWQSFMDSVRCRLNVNQVVRLVRRDATINFDFVVLLVAAALLSCVGLVENSFLFLSSSMLISPLMGPIIAGIFGSVIRDRGLRWLGIRNELIGIAISVVIGFAFGCAICFGGLSRHFVLSGGFTEEIITRCDTHSLAIGLVTALASGAAAAIGVLGGNTGSLVGVAISASLLPPAVNAGLLGAIGACMQLWHVDAQLLQSLSKHRDYSQQLHIELFICAAVSMALTLVNVLCVWLMGVVVLHIKEVAPTVQRRDQHFWRHDVRLAREVALHDPELHSAIDRLDSDERRLIDVEATQYQHTWSPGMLHVATATESETAEAAKQEHNYHTVHGFQDFCITLHKLKRPQLASSVAAPLPSFMEVFKPLPEKQEMDVMASAESCQLNVHRSLPDLRMKEHLKLPRCVHWQEEQQPSHSRSRSYSYSKRSSYTPCYDCDNQSASSSHSNIPSHSHSNSYSKSHNCNPSHSFSHSDRPNPNHSHSHSYSTSNSNNPSHSYSHCHSHSYSSNQSHSARQRFSHSGQVLLPLPPDRRLRLLRSRSNNNKKSEECDYEHEFNV